VVAPLEQRLGDFLRKKNQTLSVAESCTGGSLAQRLTSVPGSSAYFWGGVVAYHNRAKTVLLGVPSDILKKYGAVSGETAQAMAEGMRRISGTDYALSITGVAGPDGGTAKKPVGLVWVGLASVAGVYVFKKIFSGDRKTIRRKATDEALRLMGKNTRSFGGRVQKFT